MGTIIKRSTNTGVTTWLAKIRRKGHPQLTATFDSQADAEEWIEKVEADFKVNKAVVAAETARVKLAQLSDPHNLPLGYLIDRYIAEISPTKRSARVEVIRLKAMKNEEISFFTLAQLTPQVVARWRDSRLAEVSGSTVIRDLGTLGHIIETARKEWGVTIPVNPVHMIRKPRANVSRERRLTPQEEAAILKEADNAKRPVLRNIIVLALETGMRQGEIVGLDWQYVNLEQRRIHLTITKNGSPRGIPLSKCAIALLESLPHRFGPVFPDVTRESVKRAFQNACKRAGIENLHFHDLRHEATSRFFEKGLNMMEVASITGHKSLSMLKRYTHLDAGRLADKLD